jgi:hypothetical protein
MANLKHVDVAGKTCPVQSSANVFVPSADEQSMREVTPSRHGARKSMLRTLFAKHESQRDAFRGRAGCDHGKVAFCAPALSLGNRAFSWVTL